MRPRDTDIRCPCNYILIIMQVISFKISHIQGFHQNLMFSLLTPLTLYGFILYDVQNTAINNSRSPLTCPAASVLTFRQQICLVNVLYNNRTDNLIHNNQEKPHEKKTEKEAVLPCTLFSGNRHRRQMLPTATDIIFSNCKRDIYLHQ